VGGKSRKCKTESTSPFSGDLSKVKKVIAEEKHVSAKQTIPEMQEPAILEKLEILSELWLLRRGGESLKKIAQTPAVRGKK